MKVPYTPPGILQYETLLAGITEEGLGGLHVVFVSPPLVISVSDPTPRYPRDKEALYFKNNFITSTYISVFRFHDRNSTPRRCIGVEQAIAAGKLTCETVRPRPRAGDGG